MTPRRYRQVATALSLAAIAACGQDGVSPDATLSGTYHVVTINGQAPPATISQNSQRSIVLLGATLNIGADNHFVLDDTLRIVSDAGAGSQTDHRTGTYSVTGGRVTFVPDLPGALDVTTLDIGANGTLSLVDPAGSVPVTIVFSR